MVVFKASLMMALVVVNQISTSVLAQSNSCTVPQEPRYIGCQGLGLTSMEQVKYPRRVDRVFPSEM